MIYTVCLSCNTVNRAIIDRCKYCGSQFVEVKSINDNLIQTVRNREVLIKPKKVKNYFNEIES